MCIRDRAGISGVARSSSSQAYGGVAVSGGISAAQPGDVICYPGHVGIYIGGGQMIHCLLYTSGRNRTRCALLVVSEFSS